MNEFKMMMNMGAANDNNPQKSTERHRRPDSVPPTGVYPKFGLSQEVIRMLYMSLTVGGKDVSYVLQLTEAGSVDLSKLPEDVRREFEEFGVESVLIPGRRIMPEQGERFLRALFEQQQSGYGPRFRLTP